jgi:hypothetical protein
MFYIDFGDFSKEPHLFVFLENFLFSVFDFPGATGLKKGQG